MEGRAAVQFEVTPYLFQTERYTESLWACFSSHYHSASQFAFALLFFFFAMLWLVVSLCFGWDPLSFWTPKWKTCSSSGAGNAVVKSISYRIYLLKIHSCLYSRCSCVTRVLYKRTMIILLDCYNKCFMQIKSHSSQLFFCPFLSFKLKQIRFVKSYVS